MKRIKAACICQTLHFMQKNPAEPDQALVRQEVERYKQGLIRGRVPHRILEETELPDGSVILKIKKQFNTSPVGDYLD